MTIFISRARAFLKRDIVENFSYRLSATIDFFGMAFQLMVFFFIGKLIPGANAHLQIADGDYFAFVLIGLAFNGLQATIMNSPGGAIATEQSEGRLEAILMTGTGFGTLMATGLFWNLIWALLQTAGYLAAGIFFFGIHAPSANWAAAIVICALTIAALSGFGLFTAGFTLAYKKGDPVNFILNGLSKLLGGVYFPVTVLPLWLQHVAGFLPLTYTLQAARKTLLKGAGFGDLIPEISALLLFTVIFFPAGALFFSWSVRKSKREGSLNFT